MSEQNSRPPRDEFRALMPAVNVRADDGDGESDGRTLFGHFARFNEWTEIDSWFEGQFMERIAPGAFKKTFREGRDNLRVLLEHGHDPQLGNKPIADPQIVREDEEGAYYEARLFDGLPELVLEGLRAGQYGASFRFGVVREEWNDDPGASDHNPKGLPERTLKELRVPEFGPVTWGAYKTATAGVRSMTDHYVFGWISADPARARELLGAVDLSRAALRAADTQDPALSPDDAAPCTSSAPERRDPGHSALNRTPERPRSALHV